MDILVPTDKPHVPQPTGLINVLRTFAVIGWVGYVLLFSMIFSEGRVSFPHLQRTVELVLLGFLGFLLTFKWQRIGGAVMSLGMVISLILTPVRLSEWRPWFFATEGVMAIVGLLFIVAPKRRTEE